MCNRRSITTGKASLAKNETVDEDKDEIETEDEDKDVNEDRLWMLMEQIAREKGIRGRERGGCTLTAGSSLKLFMT